MHRHLKDQLKAVKRDQFNKVNSVRVGHLQGLVKQPTLNALDKGAQMTNRNNANLSLQTYLDKQKEPFINYEQFLEGNNSYMTKKIQQLTQRTFEISSEQAKKQRQNDIMDQETFQKGLALRNRPLEELEAQQIKEANRQAKKDIQEETLKEIQGLNENKNKSSIYENFILRNPQSQITKEDYKELEDPEIQDLEEKMSAFSTAMNNVLRFKTGKLSQEDKNKVISYLKPVNITKLTQTTKADLIKFLNQNLEELQYGFDNLLKEKESDKIKRKGGEEGKADNPRISPNIKKGKGIK